MVRRLFFLALLVVPIATVVLANYCSPLFYWSFVITGPLLLLGLHDVLQARHSLLRVYPIIGHGRYLMESVRPEIQQYFVENNIDGRPFNRALRSVVYQRAKAVRDTTAFGTERNLRDVGTEWVNHSINPTDHADDYRLKVGNSQCAQPYQASVLNISAMSYGSLSRTAIESLNLGAKLGAFAHNTGEGGISPYHLAHDGDLIWQVGTGYFGCRQKDGNFDPVAYAEECARPQVKMVELKLSQGAKPGHGGILPAAKVTPEIAQIRKVSMGQDVLSPPGHRAFSTPVGLLEFVAKLRELAKGKPVGFKLCIGHPHEFIAICKAMQKTQIYPDFIAIDGAEGGTGAAPLELSDSVGMPIRHGLLFAHNALVGAGLREHVRIAAAGKIITGFHIFRALALGADWCNSARGMMFALGCIQARRCNDNKCPVGVATQDPARYQGIVVKDKGKRVANFHRKTVHAFMELLETTGLQSPAEIGPEHLLKKTDPYSVHSFADVYEYLPADILNANDAPPNWQEWWTSASPETWSMNAP